MKINSVKDLTCRAIDCTLIVDHTAPNINQTHNAVTRVHAGSVVLQAEICASNVLAFHRSAGYSRDTEKKSVGPFGTAITF